MRIVEYPPDTTSLSCRALKGLAIGAGLFSVVVCVLMIANRFSLLHSDPIHAPALLRLQEQLKATPQDETLKEQIREFDYLARRAFFSSQHFNHVAIYLLLGGVVVMVVAFKTLEAYRARLPYPNPASPKEDLAANARWARRAVTAAGLVLTGLALSLAIPWKSSLDDVEETSLSASGQAVPAPASVKTAAPAEAPRNAFPAREELLKNWPGFLGAASGRAAATHLPVAWDGETGQGIVWKVEVPKPGFSSPIVWQKRIFFSGGDAQGREVYAFNTETGALLWRHEARDVPGSPANVPKVTEDTGLAASTMTTDGTDVFAIFANGDLLALDFHGNRVWSRNLGLPDNPYGHGSSLAVFEDTLLVQFDQREGGAFFGLDARTGEPRWKTPRDFGPSWSSPLLIERNGKTEVILAATPMVVSYDPRTGKELWRVECLKGAEVAPTPVFANGLLYVAAENAALVAIDVSTRSVVWKEEDLVPGVCTPVVSGDFLIYGLGDGGISCRNAQTGKEIWYQETDNGFYASPVLANDRVYLMDRAGVMHIFSAGETFHLLAEPALGERAATTPAVVGNAIFYRGTKHLFRIGS